MKELNLGIGNEGLSLVPTESSQLKMLENLWSVEIFRGYKKKTLA